jgi:hypothetical protein
MRHSTTYCTALAILVVLAGCATTQKVNVSKIEPVTSIKTVAQAPDAGNSADMDAVLTAALQTQGLTVKPALRAGTRKAQDVDAVVSYIDSWRWDIAMYLRKIDIQMFDARSGDLLVSGEWQDSPMHGFHDPLAVVQGLLAEMMARLRGEAVPAGNASGPEAPAASAPAGGVAVAEWIPIRNADEIRAIYSDTTIRGMAEIGRSRRVTPFTGQYRKDGTGMLFILGRQIPRTWEVEGNDQICATDARGRNCYRLERNAGDPNKIRTRNVDNGATVEFTVFGADR